MEAACILYDRLCPDFEDKLKLCREAKSYDEIGRRIPDRIKMSNLHGFYNAGSLRNAAIQPETVRDLLIKYQWLSVQQLPEYAHLDINKYLRWDKAQEWMQHVALQNQLLMFRNKTRSPGNSSDQKI